MKGCISCRGRAGAARKCGKSGQMTGQIPQTAGKPFPAHFVDQRPSFCIPWGIFCRTGVLAWLGIGSLRVGGLCRAGWKCLRPKTVCCRCWQLRCCAAGRCGCKCAAPDGRRGLSCPAAGRGLHGRLAGRRTGGAGAALAHRPCTGGRRPDACIYPVLCAAAGAAGAGKHRAARGLPYRGKTYRPAFARTGADGRAAAARSARTAYTVRPGGAAGRGDLSCLPQCGRYRDAAAGRRYGAGTDHVAWRCKRAGDRGSCRLPQRLRRLRGGRRHRHHPSAGKALPCGLHLHAGADRIIASTLACAAAAAGGRVELAGCAPGLYAPLLEILEQMGCTVERARDAAAIRGSGTARRGKRAHTPYPGLATDAAPLAGGGDALRTGGKPPAGQGV